MSDNDMREDRLIDLSRSYTEALNIHGYSFQYRVAKEIEDLYLSKKRYPWRISAVEFPIEIRGKSTRIDLVLKHRSRHLYIVAECKRANPAFSDWVFASASYVHPAIYSSESFVEEIMKLHPYGLRTCIVPLAKPENISHIGIEIKTDKKGNRYGQQKDHIEKAATQACYGLNGLIELFANKQDFFGNSDSIRVLPVIFTTANLFFSSVSLSDADLNTGEIAIEDVDIQPIEWLDYHYHQSPDLKHSIASDHSHIDLQDILFSEYVRNIPVVSSAGISSFLGSKMFG